MRYLPLSPADRAEMLGVIGVSTINDLFADVPADLLLSGPITGLPLHASEMAVERHMGALAAKNLGRTPASDEARSIQFPIAETREGYFPSKKGRGQSHWVQHLSSEARAAIERLQPFNSPSPNDHPLIRLRELSNADKHRHLLITSAVVSSVKFFVRRPSGEPAFVRSDFTGPFDDDTIVASVAEAEGEPVANVDQHLASLDIEFGRGPAEGSSLRTVLSEAHGHILVAVFPALEPLLE